MAKSAIVKVNQVADVLLVCTGPGTVTDQDMRQILVAAETPSVAKVLGLDAGPTELTSTQRKTIAEVASRRKLLVVAVTDERMTRGIVTAVSWLGANIKAYAWDELRVAVKQLAVSEKTANEIVDMALRMKVL